MATYYHLTPERNAEAITLEGIKANEQGKIFVFTDMAVAHTIAHDQVHVHGGRYTVFKMTGRAFDCIPQEDKVAEYVARFHRVITQPLIAAKWLTIVGTFETKPLSWPPHDEYDRAKLLDNGVKCQESWERYTEMIKSFHKSKAKK